MSQKIDEMADCLPECITNPGPTISVKNNSFTKIVEMGNNIRKTATFTGTRTSSLMEKVRSLKKRLTVRHDPEPLTILMLILAGLSAAGAWASFGEFKKRMTVKDRTVAQRYIFAADRALRRLHVVRDDLFSILDEHQHLYSASGIGSAAISVNEATAREMRRLRREIGVIVDSYSAALENLVSVLGNEVRVGGILERLKQIDVSFTSLLKRIGENKYTDILQGITELIDKQRELIRVVAELYDLRFPQQFS